jgi:tRNA(Ile)-lysidine synthetase-like protein
MPSLSLPPGLSWAVAVSGGADSVALLLLLHDLQSLHLHVVHLNHELRGQASEADAAFVRDLATRLNLPFTIDRLSAVEPTQLDLPANASARYRALRLALFRKVVADHHLQGVILAHHADDVAETVLHRLLRGSSPPGLTGIPPITTISGLPIVRPLLHHRREDLRVFLRERNQPWREDASNQSDDYLRNRLRKILSGRPRLHTALLNLAAQCANLNHWTQTTSPILTEIFPTAALAKLPAILARHAAQRYLLTAGCPPDDLTPSVLDRLIEMSSDAATPACQSFPGPVTLRRHRKQITLHHKSPPI